MIKVPEYLDIIKTTSNGQSINSPYFEEYYEDVTFQLQGNYKDDGIIYISYTSDEYNSIIEVEIEQDRIIKTTYTDEYGTEEDFEITRIKDIEQLI